MSTTYRSLGYHFRTILIAALSSSCVTRPSGKPLASLSNEGIDLSWFYVSSGNPREAILTKDLSAPTLHLTEADGLASNYVEAITQLPDGTMVFGTRHGLTMLSGRTLRTYTGPEYLPSPRPSRDDTLPGNSGLPENDIHALYVGRDGSLWVMTSLGCCRVRGNEWGMLKTSRRTVDAPEMSIGFESIQRVFHARNGSFVMGGYQAGISVQAWDRDSPRLIHHEEENNRWVTGIAEDPEGTLWIAMMNQGVIRYDGRELRLFDTGTPWIPDPNIRSIAMDRAGTIWVGTRKGLGARRTDGEYRVYTAGDDLPDDTVWQILERSNGELWFLTMKGFAVRRGNRWRYPSFGDSSGSARHFECVFEDSTGSLWFGSSGGAFRNLAYRLEERPPIQNSMDARKKAVEAVYPVIRADRRTAIDSKRRVWLVNEEKLQRYDGSRWSDLTPVLGGSAPTCLLVDAQNRVWIGTRGGAGLIRFDGDRMMRYNNEPHHAKSYIYALLEDRKGTIFAGTQYGLFALKGNTWVNLSERQGGFNRGLQQVILLALDDRDRLWSADPNYGLFLHDGYSFRRISADPALEGSRIESLTVTPGGAVRVKTARQTPTGRQEQTFECDGKNIMSVDETGGNDSR